MTKFRNVSTRALTALVLCFGVSQAYAVDWFIGVDYGGYQADDSRNATYDAGDSTGFSVGFRQDDTWTYEVSFRNYNHNSMYMGTINADVFNDDANWSYATIAPDGTATPYTATTNSAGTLGTLAYVYDGSDSAVGSAGDAVDQVDAVAAVVATANRRGEIIGVNGNDLFGNHHVAISTNDGTNDTLTFDPATDTFSGMATYTVEDVELDDSSIAFSVARHWSLSDSFDIYGKVGYDTLSVTKTVHVATSDGGNGTGSFTMMAVAAEDAILQEVTPNSTTPTQSDGTPLATQDPAATAGVAAQPELRATVNFAATGAGANAPASQKIEMDSGFTYAVGGEWKATDNFSVTAEYEFSNLARYSFGVKYFFK